MSTPPPAAEARLLAVAQALRLDMKAIDVIATFADAGIEAVLMKGPVLARRLYEHPHDRRYQDIDLLIDPADTTRAHAMLVAAGFARTEPDAVARQMSPDVARTVGTVGAVHAVDWRRESDGVHVDLHDTLPQLGVPAPIAWRTLSLHVTTMTLHRRQIRVLDDTAIALLVALHAAHHGPHVGRPIADLTRAVQRLDDRIWHEAHRLARTLSCAPTFGVGLGLVPGGEELATRLGLAVEPATVHRLLWSGAPWSASALDALLRHDLPWRGRARLLAQIVMPSPQSLRHGSDLARRGAYGLGAAYVHHWVELVRRTPAAVRAWRHATDRRP